jgi:hypothetical protein
MDKTNAKRALDSLIHDTNGKLGIIKNYMFGIERRLAIDPQDPKISENMSKIEDARLGIMSIIDKYYARAKADFSDESMGYTTDTK